MKRQPKKVAPKAPTKPHLNGHAAALLAKLDADRSDARARALANAPPSLALPAVKALAAPLKKPSLESPKDLTWVTVRRDVLEACLLAAAKKDSRHYLEGVYLHSDKDELRVVATNGHTLLLHSSEITTVPSWLVAGVILPREQLSMALGVIGKTGDAQTVQIGYAADHGCAILRDVGEFATFRLRVISGRYPAYQNVIESAGAVLAGGDRAALTATSMNGEYLKQAAAIAAKFGAKGITPFAGADASAPIVITFLGEAGALYVISPITTSSVQQMPVQTLALIGRGLEGTLAALKASQTRQKKALAESKNDTDKQAITAAIAAREERIANVVAAIKGKLLEAPKVA